MEHAVIVHLRQSLGDLASVFALEDKLEAAIEKAEVGRFDGNEFGNGECVLYMYGPDADQLFECIEPVIQASPLSYNGYAIKRYGESGAPEKEIQFRGNLVRGWIAAALGAFFIAAIPGFLIGTVISIGGWSTIWPIDAFVFALLFAIPGG
jgi:hypothetical protein